MTLSKVQQKVRFRRALRQRPQDVRLRREYAARLKALGPYQEKAARRQEALALLAEEGVKVDYAYRDKMPPEIVVELIGLGAVVRLSDGLYDVWSAPLALQQYLEGPEERGSDPQTVPGDIVVPGQPLLQRLWDSPIAGPVMWWAAQPQEPERWREIAGEMRDYWLCRNGDGKANQLAIYHTEDLGPYLLTQLKPCPIS